MKLFKKADLVIIAAVVLIAAVSAVFFLGGRADRAYVGIYVGGELYEKVPVGTAKTVTVSQDGGKVNVVEITETEVFMKSSTCPNQDCVMHTPLMLNVSEALLSDWIICLPNGVSVEVGG